jgi:hypothetical protein
MAHGCWIKFSKAEGLWVACAFGRRYGGGGNKWWMCEEAVWADAHSLCATNWTPGILKNHSEFGKGRPAFTVAWGWRSVLYLYHTKQEALFLKIIFVLFKSRQGPPSKAGYNSIDVWADTVCSCVCPLHKVGNFRQCLQRRYCSNSSYENPPDFR